MPTKVAPSAWWKYSTKTACSWLPGISGRNCTPTMHWRRCRRFGRWVAAGRNNPAEEANLPAIEPFLGHHRRLTHRNRAQAHSYNSSALNEVQQRLVDVIRHGGAHSVGAPRYYF